MERKDCLGSPCLLLIHIEQQTSRIFRSFGIIHFKSRVEAGSDNLCTLQVPLTITAFLSTYCTSYRTASHLSFEYLLWKS